MNTDSPLSLLRGVGAKRNEVLKSGGLRTLYDLFHYYPRGYEDRSRVYLIEEAPAGKKALYFLSVDTVPSLAFTPRGRMVSFTASDESGKVKVCYFNAPYMKNNFSKGEKYFFYGSIYENKGRKYLTGPSASKKGDENNRGLLPVYPQTKGLTQTFLRSLMREGLSNFDEKDYPDYLDEETRGKYGLCGEYEALSRIHFPVDCRDVNIGRKRLIFDELYGFSLGLEALKRSKTKRETSPMRAVDMREFFSMLPYKFTEAQNRALSEIIGDLVGDGSEKIPYMNRLIEGDVGSGKTAVAFGAVWFVAKNGLTSIMMAPTEILARQHARNAEKLFGGKLGVGLLCGSTKKNERELLKKKIEAGEISLLIGTHALIEDYVSLPGCGLVITDEQHRFGVHQREKLLDKAGLRHSIALSATPIPRTLAMFLYSDLSISVIDELPPGRTGVKTFYVNSSYEKRLFSFIEKTLQDKRQVYIVCPLIEENEELDLIAAQEEFERIKENFPHRSVALMHGKLKPKEKNSVMESFSAGETDILVTTTVIEVGVDVPNATLMVVENAERFGLAQLHQLRGRVGRGDKESFCVLVSDSKGEKARERLKFLTENPNGFKVAEYDLQTRGPGEFFGNRQHGDISFRMASFAENMDMFVAAKEAASEFFKASPDLNNPEVRSYLRRFSAIPET